MGVASQRHARSISDILDISLDAEDQRPYDRGRVARLDRDVAHPAGVAHRQEAAAPAHESEVELADAIRLGPAAKLDDASLRAPRRVEAVPAHDLQQNSELATASVEARNTNAHKSVHGMGTQECL